MASFSENKLQSTAESTIWMACYTLYQRTKQKEICSIDTWYLMTGEDPCFVLWRRLGVQTWRDWCLWQWACCLWKLYTMNGWTSSILRKDWREHHLLTRLWQMKADCWEYKITSSLWLSEILLRDWCPGIEIKWCLHSLICLSSFLIISRGIFSRGIDQWTSSAG